MVLNSLKNLFSGSIATSLKKQKDKYRSSKWSFNDDILCEISQDYKGIYISACLKTNDPYAGGFDVTGQVFFYKGKYFDNLNEAFDNLTKEVSEAKTEHPELNYFRRIAFNENDSDFYLKSFKSLDVMSMEQWLNDAWNKTGKNYYICEQFVGGTWVSSERLPWN